MKRQQNKLGAREVAALSKPGARPGNYGDGGNLYLQVKDDGGRCWIVRYMLDGKERYMGLGPTHTITLAEARERAREARKLLLDRIDPLTRRMADRTKIAGQKTFDQCAAAYVEMRRPSWGNARSEQTWTNSLATYASPVMGVMPVADVTMADVLRILQPIWNTRHETATRLRERIEKVLGWATTQGHRAGDNPARWKGHLENVLPSDVAQVKHHDSLPWADLGPFMHALRQREGQGAKALEFVILTATRTGAVLPAKWSEFDLDNALWTVPPEEGRVKARKNNRKPVRVPLSKPALNLLRSLDHGDNTYVFPSDQTGEPMSDMTLSAICKRMKVQAVPHGFRSTFRDWAADCTNYPNDVVERALWHGEDDEVVAAYKRTDLFERRRALMEDWARFCGQIEAPKNVVPIREGVAA